jgi:hypothetical protein
MTRLQLQSPAPDRLEALEELAAWCQNKCEVRFVETRYPALIEWTYRLRDIQRQLLHDRIFSVLALAGEASTVAVAYHTPLAELVYQVLGAGNDICLAKSSFGDHTAMSGRISRFSGPL